MSRYSDYGDAELEREAERLALALERQNEDCDAYIEENDRLLTLLSEKDAALAKLADEVRQLEEMLFEVVEFMSVGDIVQVTGLPSVRAMAIRDRALRDM